MKTTSKKSLIRTKSKMSKRFTKKDKTVICKKESKENSNELSRIEKERLRDDKVREGRFTQKGVYYNRSIVEDLINYFKSKEDKQGINIAITQDELLKELVESYGYSRSYVYYHLEKLSSGKTKRNPKDENDPIMYEPLLIKKSRHPIDGKLGWAYKFNDKWRDIPLEEIKGVFNGN